MTQNLVKELKEALGISMDALAKKVGKKTPTLNSWALLPGPEDAKLFAQIASDAGLHKIAHGFLSMAGEGEDAEADPENLSPDERKLVDWVLYAYRAPAHPANKAVVDLMWAIRDLEKQIGENKQLRVIADLSEEERLALADFLKKPEAMRIVTAVVGGGNPPSAFATPQTSSKKSGERMAK